MITHPQSPPNPSPFKRPSPPLPKRQGADDDDYLEPDDQSGNLNYYEKIEKKEEIFENLQSAKFNRPTKHSKIDKISKFNSLKKNNFDHPRN